MNSSMIVFLINDSARGVLVEYEPLGTKTIFKTLDPSIAVDDFVVVQTSTRHEMTVAKVVDVDVDVDFESPGTVNWIIQRVDADAFNDILRQENEAITAVRSAEKERKRKELQTAIFDQLKDRQDTVKSLELAQTKSDDVTD